MRDNFVLVTKLANPKIIKNLFKKSICLFFIFLSLQLYGNEKPIAISLGAHCGPALALRVHDIRTVAYPFDWVNSSMEGLCKAFEDDFEHYFLKENLIIHPHSPMLVLDTFTGFNYPHDFSVNKDSIVAPWTLDGEHGFNAVGQVIDNFLDEYDEIHEKYTRRIQRLQAALNSSQKLILIRYAATKEEAIVLRNILKRKYPTADFTLVVINTLEFNGNNEFNKIPWNEDHIKNYYFEDGHFVSQEWLYVFYDIGLLP